MRHPPFHPRSPLYIPLLFAPVAAGGGGGGEEVDSGAISPGSSEIKVTNLTGFDFYIVQFENLKIDTNDPNLHVQFSDDGGTTFKSGATDYAYAYDEQKTNGSAGLFSHGNTLIDTFKDLGGANDTINGLSGWMLIADPNAVEHTAILWRKSAIANAAGNDGAISFGSGRYNTAEAHDAIRLFLSFGNFDAGTYIAYGFK